MAAIEKRGKFQWRAKVRRKGYPPQNATFDTKGAAEVWARQIEGEMDTGVFVSRLEAQRTTLAEALDRYERDVTPAKKGWKQETYRIGYWRSHPLSARSLATIRSSDLAQWRDERLGAGYSPTTVRNDINLISHVYTVATKEWGMDGLTNPVAQIRKPTVGTEIHAPFRIVDARSCHWISVNFIEFANTDDNKKYRQNRPNSSLHRSLSLASRTFVKPPYTTWLIK